MDDKEMKETTREDSQQCVNTVQKGISTPTDTRCWRSQNLYLWTSNSVVPLNHSLPSVIITCLSTGPRWTDKKHNEMFFERN